jgi:hypothetical protein
MNFIEKNFDKLLLAFLFVVMVVLVVHTAAVRNDDTTNWAREQTSLLLGGLLGLCTGLALRKEPPAPPS